MIRKVFQAALVPAALLLAGASPEHGIDTRSDVTWHGVGELGWADSFGTAATDWANHAIELRDGGVVATGFVNRIDGAASPDWDVVLRKYSAEGQVLWTRRIGGPALDAGWAVRELADGRLAVAGFSSSAGSGANDAYLLLTDAHGATLSEHWYGGESEDRATDLVLAPDGGLLLVGQTESFGAGERDVFAVRTDAHGRELWRCAYGGPGLDRGFFAAAVPGGYVIAGSTGSDADTDYLLLRIDEAGGEVWRRVIAGERNDPNHGVAVLADGTILFTGYTASWGASENDVSAIRFSPEGEVIGHEIVATMGDDRVQGVAAAGGSAWLTGSTTGFGGSTDILVARLAGDRLEPWLGAIGSAGAETGASITLAANGDLIVAGYSDAPGGGSAAPDALVMRIPPSAIERRRDGVTVRSAH